MTAPDTSTTWLSTAVDEIRRAPHLNNDLHDILRAFGKDDNDAPGPVNLNPDDIAEGGGGSSAAIGCAIPHLQKRIATELLDEIDADQASMFSRRFTSVSTLLKDENNNNVQVTAQQLLRLALHRRTMQILSTTDPVLSQRKALRIRALVDFIWSLSLVLGLKDDPASVKYPTLAQLTHKQKQSSMEFSPGFYHSTIEGLTSDFGPVHINILRIDMHSKNGSCQMKCVDARNICTDLPTLAKQTGAVAAISGGFFLYSEPDIELPSARTDPVGMLVSDGDIAGPPVFGRAAILQTKGDNGDMSIDLGKVGMAGVTCAFTLQCSSGTSSQPFMKLTIGQENVRCIHRGSSDEVVIKENECCFSIVRNTVVSRITASSSQTIPVPLAGFVLAFPRNLLPKERDGEYATIAVSYELPQPYNNVENAMAGGPMFFSDDGGCQTMDLPSEDFEGSAPPVTFSQDETHDHNLLPRMGVGIAKNADTGIDQLVCVAVDGRNLDRALGLTLQGTSNLLRSLGCTKAMNLDGGSSKRMVVWDSKSGMHKVVCLSTTEIKANAGGGNGGQAGKVAAEHSRPVHSAILFLPGEKS